MEDPTSAQRAFLGSLFIYPIIHLASLPTEASFPRITQSREAISIFHCTLQTVLSVACLRRHSNALSTSNNEGPNLSSIRPSSPIITTQSTFGACITAIETGYLLQDSIILLHAYRQRNRAASSSLQLKGWNFLHLGLHHAILGGLLLLLQYYIAKGWAKGILVIVALHLMNASSIFGTLRWFLINFSPKSRQLILLLTVMYLATFAVCRVYLVVWIIQVYGRQRGLPVWTAIIGLPPPCKMGTTTIFAVNSIWLLMGIKNLTFRVMSQRKID